jgi:RimJ/RimL family protein N-acetyltransferase
LLNHEHNPRLLFFVSDPQSERKDPNERGSTVSWQLWRPSLTRVVPPGNPTWPFVAWWAFHMLRLFESAEYCVLLCFENGILAHRSCVFPRYYRFPFMAADDLQVGDVWSAPESRNKGFARSALTKAIARFPGRRIWYVCDGSNPASITVAQKAGLRLHAVGTRTKRLGLDLLGQFRILGNSEQGSTRESA